MGLVALRAWLSRFLLGLVCFASFAGGARAGDRFVVATDSHGIYHFGEGIENWLIHRKPKSEYDFVASGGSMPTQWTPRVNGEGKPVETKHHVTTCGARHSSRASAQTRKCEKMTTPFLKDVWAEQPKRKAGERRITIIAHGTNFATSGQSELVKTTVRLIEDAFANSDECVWIGPPNMTRKGNTPEDVAFKYTVIQDAIKQVRQKIGKTCHLIDSRKVTTYPSAGHDGVHYQWPVKGATKAQIAEGKRRANEWVRGVIDGKGAMRGLDDILGDGTAAVSPVVEGRAFESLDPAADRECPDCVVR